MEKLLNTMAQLLNIIRSFVSLVIAMGVITLSFWLCRFF